MLVLNLVSLCNVPFSDNCFLVQLNKSKLQCTFISNKIPTPATINGTHLFAIVFDEGVLHETPKTLCWILLSYNLINRHLFVSPPVQSRDVFSSFKSLRGPVYYLAHDLTLQSWHQLLKSPTRF